MSSILLPISPAGTTTANISGQNVVVSSGFIAIVSGSITVNSGAVQLLSGAQVVGGVGVVSGALSIQSGVISVNSGAISVISGSITVNSGTIFLPTTTQSGHNYVLEVGSSILIPTASGAGIGTFGSGGQTLASCGPLISTTIRSISGNGPMLVGGTTAGNTPAAGFGIELFANESLTLKVNNTNLINVFNETAGTSGQKVGIVGLMQI